VAAGLVVISVSGARLAFQALGADDGVTIHAHRGVSTRAAENTLGAVREAMVAGADYVETDVQLTKDDVLVITHDSDFSRLGGVARKVWDLTYDEIRAIPLGVSPEGRGECAPTLDALLAEVQGRAKVNLELKYYGGRQPDLARKVVEAVRARGMLGQVVIQCLEYEPLQEVRRLAPEVPVGYLLSFNAREPSRLDVDFLSVEQKRINRGFVEKAHRQGKLVYAWTVNRSTDMERVLDLGVDGLITDQTALARTTLQAYRERSGTERAKARVRAWLADE
jgi:glycerophosphoryl diester phosphodiesterase